MLGKGLISSRSSLQLAVTQPAGGRLLTVLSTVPSLCWHAGRTSLIGGNSCLSTPSSFSPDDCGSWTGWSHSGNVGHPRPGQQLASFLTCWLSRNEVAVDSSL